MKRAVPCLHCLKYATIACLLLFTGFVPNHLHAACTAYPSGVADGDYVLSFPATAARLTSKLDAVTSLGANGLTGTLVYDNTTNRVKVCDGLNWQTLTVTECPAGYTPNNGSCYRAYAVAHVWDTARGICNADGADLVVINDATENAYVNALANTTAFWIGTTDTAVEGTFKHVDNASLTYTNWNTSQPNDGGGNEDCVESGTAQSVKWNDATCTTGKYFVCEKRDSTATAGADNLGDHIATQNIRLGSNWLSGDGGDEGLTVDANGNVGIGTNVPLYPLEVQGMIRSGNGVASGGLLIPNAIGNPAFQVITNQGTAPMTAIVNNWGAATNPGVLVGTTRADGTAFQVGSSIPIASGSLTGAGTNLMTILGNGNVGVGTATPDASARLDVSSTTKGFLPPRMQTTEVNAIATPADGLIVYDTDADTIKLRANGAWVDLLAGSGSETDPQVGTLTASKWCAANAGGTAIDCTADAPATGAAGSASEVQFRNNSTGAFAANSNFVWDNTNARVGIGTASPTLANLQIETIDASANIVLRNTDSTVARFPGMSVYNFGGTVGGAPSISGINSRGNSASPSPVQSGDTLMQIVGNGQYSTTPWQTHQAAAITLLASGAFAPTSAPTAIAFSTTASGSTARTERVRITDAGNVGIGTTSPEQKLHVSGGGILLDNAQVLQWKDSVGTPRNILAYNASNNLTLYTDSTNGADIAMGLRGSELLRLRQTTANVGVGTQTPNASALLDLSSTTKGFLPPRMTTVEVTAVATPADGLIVYDTDIDAIKLRANGAWVSLANSASASASGVAGAVQFSGGSGAFASDDANFHWDDSNKRLGIGTGAPNYRFQVVETKTNTAAGTVPMSQFVLTTSPASASSAGFYSLYSQINTSGTASLTGLSPILGFLNHAGTGTVAAGYGVQGTVHNGAAGTITTAIGLSAGVDNASTGAITNAYGLTTSLNNAGGGTVANWYGLYVGALTGTAPTTGRYPIYVADTGNNYFAGNVGIGTTSPEAKFMVSGGNGAPSLTGDPGIINFTTNTSVQLTGGVENASPFAFWLQTKQSNDSGGAFPLSLNPLGGNVGIGTTNPASYKLVIDAAVQNAAKIGILTMGRSGTEYPSVGHNVRYGGTAFAYTYDGGDTASMIRFQSGKVETFTAASGTAGNAISFTTGPYVAQGGTTWSAGSDVRLKKNIQPITVLDKLDDFRAVSFDWKETGKHDLGVIAQEMYKVFPDVVDKGDDALDAKITSASKGKWGVQYDKLGALALQAAKELKAENDNLRAELKAANDNLRAIVEEQGREIQRLKKAR